VEDQDEPSVAPGGLLWPLALKYTPQIISVNWVIGNVLY